MTNIITWNTHSSDIKKKLIDNAKRIWFSESPVKTNNWVQVVKLPNSEIPDEILKPISALSWDTLKIIDFYLVKISNIRMVNWDPNYVDYHNHWGNQWEMLFWWDNWLNIWAKEDSKPPLLICLSNFWFCWVWPIAKHSLTICNKVEETLFFSVRFEN